jgi:DNA-binding FadR family transcriptional regulator
MTLGKLGGQVQPMTRAEILDLPPVITLTDLGRVLGVSEPVIRAAHRRGDLERMGIRVTRLGQQYRVVTSSAWRYLGIEMWQPAQDGVA